MDEADVLLTGKPPKRSCVCAQALRSALFHFVVTIVTIKIPIYSYKNLGYFDGPVGMRLGFCAFSTCGERHGIQKPQFGFGKVEEKPISEVSLHVLK